MEHMTTSSPRRLDQETLSWEQLMVDTADGRGSQVPSCNANQSITPSRTTYNTPGAEDDWAKYSQTSNYTTPGSTFGECVPKGGNSRPTFADAMYRGCTPERSPSVYLSQDSCIVAGPLNTSRASHARRTSRESRVSMQPSQGQAHGCLTKPLSGIAREDPSIVVADVAAFSMRSTDIRHSEATKAGKVKRPLNAFMLYRKAYQNVAKTQCKRDNHQQVSSICGESWKMREPSSVIDHFNHLASVEKQLHERAFPEYRYDPVPAKRLRDSAEADRAYNSDKSDADTTSRSRRGGRGRSARPQSRLRKSLVGDDNGQQTNARETFQFDHWQGALSAPFPDVGQQGSFTYSGLESQATRGSGPIAGQLFDVMLPFSGSYSGQTVMSFKPGEELDESCLDPTLRQAATSSRFGQLPVLSADDFMGWGVGAGEGMPDLDANGAHNAYLRGTDADWTVEQLGEGSHFEDWMGQSEAFRR